MYRLAGGRTCGHASSLCTRGEKDVNFQEEGGVRLSCRSPAREGRKKLISGGISSSLLVTFKHVSSFLIRIQS